MQLGDLGLIFKSELHAPCSLNHGLIIIFWTSEAFTSVSLSKQDKIFCVVATYL